MADPLDELRILKTQLRELRWTTQVDSLKTLARESARGPGARGGISKATIGNVINPDNSTMPRWETYEIFIDTCLRLIDRAGAEPPADGRDLQVWRLRYIQVRDALGDNGDPGDTLDDAADESAGVTTSGVAEPDSVRDSARTPPRRGRWPVWLTAATVLALVAALLVWQVADEDEPELGSAATESAPSLCAELGGKLVLEDSFTDPNTGWPQHGGKLEYDSGAYRLTATSGIQEVHASAPIPSLTNSCMEAVVRMEAGFGGVALWCRAEQGDLARRYFFAVGITGHWSIAMGQPVEARVAVLAGRDSLPGLDLKRETRIGASCRSAPDGVDLVISVNGHRLRHLDPESQLTSGTVGVVGWSWLLEPGASSSFLIEEIRIWELPTVG
ncbi:hypothetical protein [Nocardia sp. XZ_19_385]|uniref:hypothetical protein n=1 Tax=Nocardia sp. XZ_19_385 TaxID=2769488 RepID=UPI00188E3CA4|nr:hypothetical protein [Nocardia sp. XZ_19_385]